MFSTISKYKACKFSKKSNNKNTFVVNNSVTTL